MKHERPPHSIAKNDLQQEARLLSLTLFHRTIHPDVEKAYVRAHDYLDALRHRDREQSIISQMLKKQEHLLATEIAWRYKQRLNLLTQKMHTLCYLTEAHPSGYNAFINERSHRPGAWFFLFYDTLISVALIIKGLFILRRYHL